MTDGALPAREFDWVFFDFDGTLRHSVPDGLEVFAEFAAESGLETDEDSRRRARRWNMEYWASSEELKADARAAGDDRQTLYLRYTRRHLRVLGASAEGVEELAERLHRRMREEYDPADHVPEDVLPALSQLRERGFRLGLLTNRRELAPDTMRELGLSDSFEFALAAGETDWWKPDPRLFSHTLERVAGVPGRTLYVGDNPFADVQGAQAAGLQPILVDPDRLFPEVGCPVIDRVGQLPSLLATPSATDDPSP